MSAAGHGGLWPLEKFQSHLHRLSGSDLRRYSPPATISPKYFASTEIGSGSDGSRRVISSVEGGSRRMVSVGAVWKPSGPALPSYPHLAQLLFFFLSEFPDSKSGAFIRVLRCIHLLATKPSSLNATDTLPVCLTE